MVLVVLRTNRVVNIIFCTKLGGIWYVLEGLYGEGVGNEGGRGPEVAGGGRAQLTTGRLFLECLHRSAALAVLVTSRLVIPFSKKLLNLLPTVQGRRQSGA